MENKDYIKQLLGKYLDNTASEQELQALFAALEAHRNDEEWTELLLPVFRAQAPDSHYQTAQWDPVIDNILQHSATPAVSTRVRRLRRPARVAAATCAIIALVTGSYLLYNDLHHPATTQAISRNTDIAPIGNRAVLTLADGSTVTLDSSTIGTLSHEGSTLVVQEKGNFLSYNKIKNSTPQNSVLQYNTLTTPKGGQFQLVLPDGTKVWLNAATTLRYPVNFPTNERKVELLGEAYFEVAANAKAPFKVTSTIQQIDVLGTSFNVNAYPEEPVIKTTLLQGSVRVTNPTSANQQSAILTPGQQSQLANHQITIDNHADVQQAIAWKDGQLVMADLDIKALMRQIARWYDVKVIYEGQLPDGHFGGIIDHKVYLSNIIDVLDSRGIHCRLEGKNLYISSK